MTAADRLADLYGDWRRLSETEGDAIRREAWPEVGQCQEAKLRLQPLVIDASSRIDPAAHERQFRSVVAELMRREQRNSELLRERRQSAERRRDEIDKAGRHLRQLHRSYAPAAAGHWHSYS